MRYRRLQTDASKNSCFFEITRVFMRVDHVATRIEDANL
jgi:hypothetical protein